MPSTGPAADAARAAFRERMEAKGHAVENARKAVDGAGGGVRVGARSRGRRSSARCSPTSRSRWSRTRARSWAASRAEAARFILRAISRELDNA